MRLINTSLVDQVYNDKDFGESVVTDFINSSSLDVVVMYNYELLLELHRPEVFNFSKYLYRKMITHVWNK
jgi:hypothetical protein